MRLYETTPCICDKICSVLMPIQIIGYVDGMWSVPDIVVRRIVAGCGRQRSGHRAIISVFVGSVRREAGLPAAAAAPGTPRVWTRSLHVARNRSYGGRCPRTSSHGRPLHGFFERWKKKGGIITVQDRLCDGSVRRRP